MHSDDCPRISVSAAEETAVKMGDTVLQRLALTDPYVAVSYSGVEGLTDLLYAEYNPVFFQDIIYNIEVRFHTSWSDVISTFYDGIV